jgi:hypothetical protein
VNPKESVYESLTIACLHAVRRAVANRWPERPVDDGDEAALHRVAPLTHEISNVHGTSSAKVRKHLRQLQAEGCVICSSHPGWTSRWWPTGFADALAASRVTEGAQVFYEMPAIVGKEAA